MVPQAVQPQKLTKMHKNKHNDGPKAKRQKSHIASSSNPPRQVLDVYVFGSGASGELGLGVAPTDKKRDPTLARYPTRNHLLDAGDKTGVIQVAAGGMHAAALTRDGRVLTWGVNDNKALGRDTKWEEPPEGLPDDVADLNPLESSPSAVVFPVSAGRLSIIQVAACDSATFALTDDGQVYGWGSFRVSFLSAYPLLKYAFFAPVYDFLIQT